MGFKTAIVTSIAEFRFRGAIRPTRRYIDSIFYRYVARCEKSNPRMYGKVLELLDVGPREAVMIVMSSKVLSGFPRSWGLRLSN